MRELNRTKRDKTMNARKNVSANCINFVRLVIFVIGIGVSLAFFSHRALASDDTQFDRIFYAFSKLEGQSNYMKHPVEIAYTFPKCELMDTPYDPNPEKHTITCDGIMIGGEPIVPRNMAFDQRIIIQIEGYKETKSIKIQSIHGLPSDIGVTQSIERYTNKARCSAIPWNWGKLVLTVDLPGRERFWVAEKWNAGSGGRWGSVEFFRDPSLISKYEDDDYEVC